MTTIKALTETVNRQFGQGSIGTIARAEGEGAGETAEPVPSLSTGSLALDRATGIGGYPVGRVVEIYGPELAGKSTLALHAVASAQRSEAVAAYIDLDHAFDPAYARAIGVRLDKVLVSQPDTGEQALDIAEVLARSGAVGLVVVDSLAGFSTRAEIEGEGGDDEHARGLRARLLSQALRKLTAIAHRTGTTIVFVNTLREKIGSVYAGSETAGNALKFYASMRLDVRRVGAVKVGEETVGGRTRIKIAKNKCAPPFTEAEVEIRYGQGIDRASELLDLGIASGVIERAGTRHTFPGGFVVVGRERARECIANGESTRSELLTAIAESHRSAS